MLKEDLFSLKLCALLHDIGKPKCWAESRRFSDHIYYTYEILKENIGSRLAEIAMRHHTNEKYYKGNTPSSDEEWLVAIADKIATGMERALEPDVVKKGPPIDLVFPLSRKEEPLVVRRLHREDLMSIHENVSAVIREACTVQGSPEDLFRCIYEDLERRRPGVLSLHDVPADTRPPLNDHSLWSHMKMTSALATCIYLECERVGRLIGKEPDIYEFALIGGDADGIKAYINRSLSLPDLRGGSSMIKEATEKATEPIRVRLGPDCVVFAGGGSFLAIAPSFMADELASEAERSFEEATDGELTITVRKVEGDGAYVRDHFGDMWRKLQLEVRKAKIVRAPQLPEAEVREGKVLCDVCRMRPGVEEPALARMLPYDMSPRRERLCEACLRRRARGKVEGRPIKLDELEDEAGYIAIIKADADDVGRVFSGESFEECGRKISPAKLEFMSRYIHEVCEEELRRIVEEEFGGEVIYAGGDDLLAIVKGRDAFECARAVHDTFVSTMHEQMTMSLGVLMMKSHFPIYVGLLAVSQLLDNAKSLEGKNGTDFDIIYQIGITKEDVSYKARERLQKKKLTARPYKWDDFVELLDILEELKGEPMTQLRTIEDILMFRGDERIKAAETFIKSQIGRCIISYRVGKRLLKALSKGFLTDALMVMERVG